MRLCSVSAAACRRLLGATRTNVLIMNHSTSLTVSKTSSSSSTGRQQKTTRGRQEPANTVERYQQRTGPARTTNRTGENNEQDWREQRTRLARTTKTTRNMIIVFRYSSPNNFNYYYYPYYYENLNFFGTNVPYKKKNKNRSVNQSIIVIIMSHVGRPTSRADLVAAAFHSDFAT